MKAFLFHRGKRSAAEGIEEQSSLTINSAKLAGLFYLIFILTFVIATYVRSQLIVFDDPAATALNITTNDLLFRFAFVTEIISALFFVLAAWALYVLLRSVNQNLALLFLLLNLCGVVVECVNMLNLFAALPLLGDANYLMAIPTDQLQAQALLYIGLYTNGRILAQIFFGSWLLPLGYLVYRSGFLPRALGILLIIDFFSVMIWFLQFFLLPGYDVISYPGLAVSLVAEVSISLWLLIKGVKDVGGSSKESC